MPGGAFWRKRLAPLGLGVSPADGLRHAAFRQVHLGPVRVHREGQMGGFVACGAED